MRNALLTAALIFAIGACFGVATADAQSGRKLTSTPKSFQAFYLKFKTAVARRDQNAVAALTKFPFRYGWDAGDEGTYTRRQFMSKFNLIFDGTAKLFAQKNPTFYVENGSYFLTNSSDASHYTFEKRGTTYAFAAMIVEP